ncbi:N-terminal phage integrase SAM-like domain-containing protein [Actinoplanes sp. N902-109]|uniref:N-terminal phage integrase SAM-like domain-containing protein n=1 Tax=Actinoplanes sp. (strain N902-109) TaxID=649831 RepID=UPI0003294239|nr:N-terminal phage integrase SAM-like domain-containing protein [Actinoplanes sp. N902-109]AGL13729.1 integrase family protein [Actinoplanes sp. N902-109]
MRATHGCWAYQLELPLAIGSTRRRQLRRGGFNLRDQAVKERDDAKELLALAAASHEAAAQIATALLAVKTGHPLPDRAVLARRIGAGLPPIAGTPLGDYLWQWHRSRKIQATTLSGYAGHIRNYLQPYLGHIPVDELRVAHIQTMFDAIIDRNTTLEVARQSNDKDLAAAHHGARIVSAATLQRIRATLRKALNDAIRTHRLIEFNPAAHVELPSGKRPKAKIWTAAAVTRWQPSTTGRSPRRSKATPVSAPSPSTRTPQPS